MINRLVENYLSKAKGLPFFYAVSDENYKLVLDDLKQAGLEVIKLSNFCKKPDKFPALDDLIDSFRIADVDCGSNKWVVIGLGEYLALRGEEEALKVLRALKYTTLGIGRVVILLRHLHSQVHNLEDEDLKLKSSGRVCYDSGVDEFTSLINVQTNSDLGLVKEGGFIGLLKLLEDGANGEIYFKSDLDYSHSMLAIKKITNSYDAIKLIIKNFPLAQSLGNSIFWDKFLYELQKKRSIDNILYDVDDIEYDFTEKALGLEYDNWKYFIALKINSEHIKNPYLKYIVEQQNDFDSFMVNVVNGIIHISHNQADFMSLYSGRKKLLKDLSDSDELISNFIRENEIDPSESIYKFTDNTVSERYAIIRWVSQYGLVPEIKYIYPALDSYLKRYVFNCGRYSDDFTNYFDEYKRQKICNVLSDEFIFNVSNNAYKYTSLDTRENILAAISEKDSAYLYWIDALGVEYLSFITDLANSLGLGIKIDIVRAELPTITSINRAFYDNWQGPKIKESRLDDIKHKDAGGFNYTTCKQPIHLADELDVILGVMKRASSSLSQHKYNKVIIASDHGASRLAVIAQIEEKYQTDTKGEHSGRCCKYFDGCDIQNSMVEHGYIVLTDYGRFKGSRAANVEVHGGASLEETVVPIITLSLKNGDKIDIRVMNPDNIIIDRKAGIKFNLYISNVSSVEQLKIIYNDVSYNGMIVDDTHYSFAIPQIKRAGVYAFDVFDDDNLIGQVSIRAKGSVGSSKSDFDDLF